MIKLKDFYHLPQLDKFYTQMIADHPSTIIVTGMDPHQGVPGEENLANLSSGRSTMLGIVLHDLMQRDPSLQTTIITKDKTTIRLSRQLKSRVKWALAEPPMTYKGRIIEAVQNSPSLIVVDQLCEENADILYKISQEGHRLLTQFDTCLWGEAALRHLAKVGASMIDLGQRSWVFGTHRMPTLCSHCKLPAAASPDQMERLTLRYPQFIGFVPKTESPQPSGQFFFEAKGCDRCHYTGRLGEIVAFDIFHTERKTSLLSLEEYIFHLALSGYLALDDLLWLELHQLQRIYTLLSSSEQAYQSTTLSLRQKLAELESAQRVMIQRTESLISLQDLGQAIISSSNLKDVAAKVCRHAQDRCSADRIVLYYLPQPIRDDTRAEVLAVVGWDPAQVDQQVEPHLILLRSRQTEFLPGKMIPPGIRPLSDIQEAERPKPTLSIGLRIPLIAQGNQVGLMMAHTTQKPSFSPGEIALLQTFANQAALAIQRASLVEDLRAKIAQLEAAQVELVKKERLDREMELARQVQQKLLPSTFLEIPNFKFATGYIPARQVGGDFYDLISLDDTHFAILIADVSDKGIPAALYMTLTRCYLQAEAQRSLSPRQVLAQVNQHLLEMGEPSNFVSVFFGIVDMNRMSMSYIRAGHEPPLLLRQGEIQLLTGRGAILGILENHELDHSEEKIDLEMGDRLVLYTDGIIDALNPSSVPFDIHHLKQTVISHRDKTAAEICAAVLDEVTAYQEDAEQYDDITIFVVQIDSDVPGETLDK